MYMYVHHVTVLVLVLVLGLVLATGLGSSESSQLEAVTVAVRGKFPANLNNYFRVSSDGPNLKASSCAAAFNRSPPKELIKHVQWFKAYVRRNYTIGNTSQIYRGIINMRSAVFNSTLTMVNSGAGTTGTRSWHQHYCDLLKTNIVHHDMMCNGQKYSGQSALPIVTWLMNDLYYCVRNRTISRTSICTSDTLFSRFKLALIDTFDGVGPYPIRGFTDTPMATIYPYLYALLGDQLQLIFLSVRNPSDWWKSRKEHHTTHVGMICNSAIWNDTPHPFDFITCLLKRRYAVDAIMLYPRLMQINSNDAAKVDRIFANAYIMMNTYHALITPQSKLHIQCVWDFPDKADPFIDTDKHVLHVLAQPKPKIAIKPIASFPTNLSVYLHHPGVARTCLSAFNVSTLTPQMKLHVDWHRAYMRGNFSLGNQSRIFSDLHLLKPLMVNSTLRTVNSGAGTTGTRELHKYNCQQLGATIDRGKNTTALHSYVHYDYGCNGFNYSEQRYPLVKWFIKDVYNCVVSRRIMRNRNCLTSTLYESFKKSLVHSFKYHPDDPLYGVSDTPMCFVYPYMLPLLNENLKLVVQSVRDSTSWWKSRWSHHTRSAHVGLICNPDLWGQVAHPFDLIGCMAKRRYPNEALFGYPRFIAYNGNNTKRADALMAKAFTQMNMYNALITPQEKHHIVCLWDHELADATPMTFEDDRFLKNWLLGHQFKQPLISYVGSSSSNKVDWVGVAADRGSNADDDEGNEPLGSKPPPE